MRRLVKQEELQKIVECIDVTFQQSKKDELSIDDLIVSLHRCYPGKQAEILEKFVTTWKTADFDRSLVKSYLEEETRRAKAYDLAVKALAVSEGRGDFSELSHMLDIEPDKGQEFDIVTHSLSDLQAVQKALGGLTWPIDSLNSLIGPVPATKLVGVFGRPNIGKTSFMATIVPFFARQLDRPTVVIANEEAPETVQIRYMQSRYKVTEAELFANKDKYQSHWDRELGKKLMITGDPALLQKKNIERLLDTVNPGLIVIDQLAKVVGFTKDRQDQEITEAWKWARNLAKKHKAVVIGISQASASGEGRRWLRYIDLAESKTGVQGECDLLIGIGKEDESPTRYLVVLKDKLPLAGDKDPNRRHGKEVLLLDQDIARYKDVAQ